MYVLPVRTNIIFMLNDIQTKNHIIIIKLENSKFKFTLFYTLMLIRKIKSNILNYILLK